MSATATSPATVLTEPDERVATATQKAPGKPPRVSAIDGLRTVAIAAVIFLHLSWNAWLGGGQAGVTIFFVISGYLITSGLLKEHVKTGRISLKAFYTRRFWRLGPALLMVVLLGLLGAVFLSWAPDFPVVAHPDHYLQTALLTLTQTLNFAAIGGHTVSYELMPTWSLAVEEQFYLLWAATLFVTLLLGSRRLAAGIAISGAVLSFGWSWFLVFDGATRDRVAYAPDTQFGGLMLGAVLAFALSNDRFRTMVSGFWTRQVVGWLSAIVIAMFILNRPIDFPLYTWGQIVLALATAACITLLVTTDPARPGLGNRALSVKALVWIGERSYFIYLVHVMVMQWLGGPGGFWRGVAVIAVSIGLAALSYRYVEQPLIQRARARSAAKNQSTAMEPALLTS